jgi:hypothetical protein
VRHLEKPSLCALALTYKRFSLSAAEVLYRTYVNRDAPSIAPFALFLRTMCTRPDLAAKVQFVFIRSWRPEHEVATGAGWRGVVSKEEEAIPTTKKASASSKSRQLPGVSETFMLFVNTAVNLGMIGKRESYPVPPLKPNTKLYTTLKAERDFVRLLMHGDEDAHVVLLLALVLHLDRLHIDGLTPYPILDWKLFLSRVTTALRSLKCLIIHGSFAKPSEPVFWTDLKILEVTPVLQQIHIGGIRTTFSENSPIVMASKTVERVVLMQSTFDLKLLENMLAEQQLTTFFYHPGTI